MRVDSRGPAIEARGVRKRYSSAASEDRPALDGFDLSVPAGSVHGLLGQNGAGKTTALRIMSTLLDLDEGEVRIAGCDVVRQGRQVRQHIGLVGQYAAVDEELSGKQNLVMFGRLSRLSPRKARSRAGELLEQFGLADTGSKRVSAYSGGMRRRLDLAAALIITPQVLFVDEPTTGLDPSGRRDVWDAIRALVRSGTTVLLTTQYLEEADQLADRISLLAHGRVVAGGTPGELKADIGDDWLELNPHAQADTQKIKDLVAPFTSGEIHEVNGRLQIPVIDRAASLLGVAVVLREADIALDDLTIRTPSLDEVFLHLTGTISPDEATHETDETAGAPA